MGLNFFNNLLILLQPWGANLLGVSGNKGCSLVDFSLSVVRNETEHEHLRYMICFNLLDNPIDLLLI